MRYAIPLVVLGVLLTFFAVGLRHDPRILPSPLIGKAAPAFSLPVLEFPQPEVTATPPLKSNADFLGKPLLVNFFASWCAGCQVEHPFLMSLAKTGAVTIVGVDYKDADADVRQWLGSRGNPYAPVLADLDGRTGIDWGVYGVPETFVIDRKGTIAFKLIGPITPNNLEAVLKPEIEKALNSGA